MHEVIKEIKSSHLGYIQEKIEKLIKELFKNVQDKKSISYNADSGIFNGKEQLRVHVLTRNSDIWNEIINKSISIDEFAIKYRLIGYKNFHSIDFDKNKETRIYKIILNTEKYSLHYIFTYRIKFIEFN